MIEEIWKDYDEKYKVSSLGRVWNKIRDVECKIRINKVGYCSVTIHGKGIGLHRIVALTFLENPLNKPTVNHKNAIKGDNRLSNLEWATYKEQMQHVRINRLNPRTKYVCLLDSNNNIIETYPSLESVGKKLNINASYVNNCCKGATNSIEYGKFRYYDINNNDYIRTRYDFNEVKLKGEYRKKIYCKDNDKTYNTQMECAKDLGILQTQVSKKLKLNKNCGFDLSYAD